MLSCIGYIVSAPDVPLYRVDPVKEKHTEIIVTVLYENCYSERGGRPVMYQLVYEKFDGKMKESAACPEGDFFYCSL